MTRDVLLAFILDFFLGDPQNFPHPVRLMGKIIQCEEKAVRRWASSPKDLRVAGYGMTLVNLVLGYGLPFALLRLLRPFRLMYHSVNIYLLWSCLAARSLGDEALKILKALEMGLAPARKQLSYIVGRDTKNLSEEEMIRATVETVAENTSDGVIAPLGYVLLLGTPGGILYKFVNTMDSMLGYKNEKYADLGFAPAKCDDGFNYFPARLSALMMNLSSWKRFNGKEGFCMMLRDGAKHESPNAGYPEAAVAGLLGIRLGGSSTYQGKTIEKPSLGDGRFPIQRKHIGHTVEILYRCEGAMILFYLLLRLRKKKRKKGGIK